MPTLEAAPGFEPGVKLLQSLALPLGYAALIAGDFGRIFFSDLSIFGKPSLIDSAQQKN
jgi:hypothetical protein